MDSNSEVKGLTKCHIQKIECTQGGFSRPNSQQCYLPQVIQSSLAAQPYPGFYHKRLPYYISKFSLDSTLIIPEKGKDVHSKSNLDSMRAFKCTNVIVGKYGDRSSGRNEKAGTNCKNCNSPSTSAANGDQALSDERDDSFQGLSATLRTNADDYLMVEDSAADKLGTVSRTTKISDDSELRQPRRRQRKWERAKRSRSCKEIYVFPEREKLQARIETLKADSHELSKQLKGLSKECARIDDENQLIKDELIQMYGPGIIHDLKDSFPELFDQENEVMQK